MGVDGVFTSHLRFYCCCWFGFKILFLDESTQFTKIGVKLIRVILILFYFKTHKASTDFSYHLLCFSLSLSAQALLSGQGNIPSSEKHCRKAFSFADQGDATVLHVHVTIYCPADGI